MKFEITDTQIREMCQKAHNSVDQNGEYSGSINDSVKETLLIRFEEWLEDEVDWDGIEDLILGDDRETREYYYEREQAKQELQGWK